MRLSTRWFVRPLRACGVALAGVMLAAAAPTPAMPVVVELFTSEGCSSCPPADTLLQQLVDTQPVAGAQVIGLGLHVDYWDQQGWRDRFSSAALTNRQQAYGRRFNLESVYTPQMVVDGRSELVGSDVRAARQAIERAAASPHGIVQIAVEPAVADRVAVSVVATNLPAGSAARSDIVLAIVEDHLRSDVTRGENSGRVLTHAAVVRQLRSIGQASADARSAAQADVALGRDWQRDRLKAVAFVQERASRVIVASAVAPLPPARP